MKQTITRILVCILAVSVMTVCTVPLYISAGSSIQNEMTVPSTLSPLNCKSAGLILKYSSTWMDTVRNVSFGSMNTNRLVRFYQGCNGLKTGSTAKAGFAYRLQPSATV